MFLSIIISILASIIISAINKATIKLYIVSAMLSIYMLVVLNSIVGFPTYSEFAFYQTEIYNPAVQIIPFAEGVGFSDRLNVLLFVPFGFMLSLLFGAKANIYRVSFYGLLFSLTIEVAQLFTLYRITDATDLLTNTLGTAIGCIIYKIIVRKSPTVFLPSLTIAIYITAISSISFLLR